MIEPLRTMGFIIIFIFHNDYIEIPIRFLKKYCFGDTNIKRKEGGVFLFHSEDEGSEDKAACGCFCGDALIAGC